MGESERAKPHGTLWQLIRGLALLLALAIASVVLVQALERSHIWRGVEDFSAYQIYTVFFLCATVGPLLLLLLLLYTFERVSHRVRPRRSHQGGP